MVKKKKILLLFPDGVGIRNYLYSNVFKHTEAELILYHSFDAETVEAIKKETGIQIDLEIPKYKESIKEKFLRELICLARLKRNAKKCNNKTILSNWNRKHKTFSKKFFYSILEGTSFFITKYKTILKLETLYNMVLKKNIFYEVVSDQLKEIAPDLIFCSHQRAIQAAPIFLAAKNNAIKTVTVVFSWDNLPKARMAVRADKYLVWSEYMKKEMQLFYPEIMPEAICITGTPQFEFYENPSNIIPKEIFFNQFDLDPSKKIICYSGDDVLTSPDDPKYLEDLAEELIENNLQEKFQILLRRCPVDLSDRFESIIKKYPKLIKEAPPVWNFNNKTDWTAVYPLFDDVKLLVSTVYYSEMVVNVGSTMAFDFAMFKKPCIFINYDQVQKNIPDWTVKTIYQFEHFKSMPNKKAIYWLNDKKEIVSKINEGLSFSSLIYIEMWKNIVIGDHLAASEKISREMELNKREI